MAKGKFTKLTGVEFASVSFGSDTARVGCRMRREERELTEMDELLTGARLEVRMSLVNEDQPKLPMPGAPKARLIEGQADCKHLGVSSSTISFGLTFARSSIDANIMADLANGSGILELKRVGDADTVADGDAGGDDAQEDAGDA
jgi:hypothetical protein